MTIDEAAQIAFEAAATKKIIKLKMGEAFCFLTDDGWNEAITAGLKAYEAARWRPIVQLPRDVSFIGPISGGDLHVSVMTDQGEIFCKIDPPTK